MHPQITAGYRQRLLSVWAAVQKWFSDRRYCHRAHTLPGSLWSLPASYCLRHHIYKVFDCSFIIVIPSRFVNIKSASSIPTFSQFLWRFLYKLRKGLFSSKGHSYAPEAPDEFPSSSPVIASFLSRGPKKYFYIFLTKPLDSFSFMLYIVDTKKKGMIPMK